MTDFAKDLLEMMTAWEKIVSAAAAQFPEATDEERFQIASGAFRKAIGVAA